jgi:hypothetical protein
MCTFSGPPCCFFFVQRYYNVRACIFSTQSLHEILGSHLKKCHCYLKRYPCRVIYTLSGKNLAVCTGVGFFCWCDTVRIYGTERLDILRRDGPSRNMVYGHRDTVSLSFLEVVHIDLLPKSSFQLIRRW